MNITLTPEQETFIQSQVKQGKYETVEQLLSEALRLLEERDTATPRYRVSCRAAKRLQERVETVKDLLPETAEIDADRQEKTLPINIPQEKITEFCQRHYIYKLSLFGSVLREDFTEESDVDFLVEFEPGKKPSLMGIAGIEIELSEIIGRKADLRTPDELSRYFRDRVLAEAVVQYVQD